MEYFHGILCMYDAFYSYGILEYKLDQSHWRALKGQTT